MNSFAEWKNEEYIITLKYSKDEIIALSKVKNNLDLIQLVCVAKYLTNNGLIRFEEKKVKEVIKK